MPLPYADDRNTTHLGDGAYCTYLDGEFVVWCDRLKGVHRVHLDAHAVMRLATFVAMVKRGEGH